MSLPVKMGIVTCSMYCVLYSRPACSLTLSYINNLKGDNWSLFKGWLNIQRNPRWHSRLVSTHPKFELRSIWPYRLCSPHAAGCESYKANAATWKITRPVNPCLKVVRLQWLHLPLNHTSSILLSCRFISYCIRQKDACFLISKARFG